MLADLGTDVVATGCNGKQLLGQTNLEVPELEADFTIQTKKAIESLDGKWDTFIQASAGTERRRALELGSLEGYWTLKLADVYEQVVAVEYREESIQLSRFIRDKARKKNIEFIHGDVQRFEWAKLGHFDLVFNSGVLYHVPEPWRLLKQLRSLANSMFVCTHVGTDDPEPEWAKGKMSEYVTAGGYIGKVYTEGGLSDPLSGIEISSFWPTEEELERMFSDTGWEWEQLVQGIVISNGFRRVQYFCR